MRLDEECTAVAGADAVGGAAGAGAAGGERLLGTSWITGWLLVMLRGIQYDSTVYYHTSMCSRGSL